MNPFLTALFGASWKTTLLGYVQLFAVTAWSAYQGLAGKEMTQQDWINIGWSALIAVGLRLAKDHNVSNSPDPVEPKTFKEPSKDA